MSDLNNKLATLQTQLSAAKGELEAAQAKASQTDDLHEKLNHITRARAAQDVINDIEREITTVQNAIAEAQRREHRQELLEEARAIAAEVEQHQGELQDLLGGVARAVHRLQQRAPAVVSRWHQARERWLSVFSSLEPGGWPSYSGDVENTRRLEALQRVLRELGDEGQALVALPPGLMPSNRLERVSHESRNWTAAPPQTGRDFAALVLDAILSQPFSPQPAAVLAPEPSRSL
jgi:chromosome segregation ATPase